MLRSIVLALMLMFTASAAHASFIYDMPILEKADIVKLSDEKLIDTYMDTIVELEASKAYHTTSGFTPKEYTAYKDLIKYRLRLMMEIHSRNLDLPSFDR